MATQNLFGDLALDSSVQSTNDKLDAFTGTRDLPAAADQKGVAMLVVRGDSDTIETADGDLSMIRVDEEGRVKVASKTASFPAVVGVANAVSAQVAVDVSRASNVVFHVKNIGSVTMAAGTFIFEASLDSTNGTDGTWFGIQAARSNANTIELSIALSGIAAGAGNTVAWEASVNAYKWFRIRCSVAVTASASAQWTILRGSYATEPIPALQSHAVSGTVTSNIGTAGLTVYTDSAANLGAAAVFTGTSRDGGPTPAYARFVASAIADQAGTLYVQKSTDATTWRHAAMAAVSANVPVELDIRVTARYYRVYYVNGGVAQTQFLLTSAYQRI